MADYKESSENPLHREFGIWSNTKYIIKKMMQYQPSVFYLMIIGLVCGSILSYFWGFFGKYVIDILQMDISEEEGLQRLVRVILIAGGIAAVLTFARSLSNAKRWYRFIYVRMQMINERIERVLNLKYELLEKPDVLDMAERASQATNGNNNGIEGMMNLMAQLGESAFTVLVTFAAVTVLDVRLIFVLVILTILQFLYYRYIIKKDKAEVWDRLSDTWRKTSYMERVTQDFDYAKDIRLFDLGGFLSKKQEEIYSSRVEKMDHHRELWFRHATVVQSVNVVIKVLIYLVLFAAVFRKGLSVGNFTLFLSLSLSFSGALLNFLHRFGDYKKASLETDDFRSFMELEVFDDEADCIPVPETDSYEIEFVNVSYRYLKADRDALSGLNLKLHPGERLAVVGLNGAGKTTMIKLLLRLYDPTEGVITLNGTDIRKFKRKEYYKLFAPVFQNIELFAFLMSENVAMESAGKLDREKAIHSVAEAGLAEKLASLAKGIDTPLTNIVEEDGVDLSGGEKQKLALAKALYKEAKIIVLDEPTSALDAIAEQNLYERFDEMIGKKSAVYISHRLASTRFCNRIAMFESGKMTEYGSHDELMEQNGKYAEMFRIQAQYYRENLQEDSDNAGTTESGVTANA